MRTRLAAALAAFALLVLAVAAGPASGVAPAAVDVGAATCTTNSTGYCTVPHGLGSVPVSVLATTKAPISGTAASQITADSFTASNFRVRVRQPSGSAFVGSTTFSFAAYAGAAPTSSSTSTTGTTTTPPPTTTTPPPTTSSTTSTTSSTTTPPPAGGWPDATNTGVPAGTTLTAYTGPTTITTAGTVIDGKRVTGCIVIQANNVTIRNSLLQTNGCFFNVLSDDGNTGLQLTDVEIDGQGNTTGDSAINGGGFTCTRCDIHGTSDGIKAQSGVIVQDSWIHDLAMTSSSHNDGIQSLGTTSLQIRHNRIVVADGSTAAVILSTGSASDMRNVAIDNNLLGGGAFTVYAGYDSGVDQLSKVSNISVTDNRFTTVIHPRSGAFGPLTSADPPVVVSGNVWHDGPNAGQPI